MSYTWKPGKLYVKDPQLKREVYSKMNRLDSKAEKSYKRGNIKEGRKFEKSSDALYNKYYYKMFGVKKR